MELLILCLLKIFCSARASIFEFSNPIFEGNRGVFSHNTLEDGSIPETFHPLFDEEDTKSYSERLPNTDTLNHNLEEENKQNLNFPMFLLNKSFHEHRIKPYGYHNWEEVFGPKAILFFDAGNPKSYLEVKLRETDLLTHKLKSAYDQQFKVPKYFQNYKNDKFLRDVTTTDETIGYDYRVYNHMFNLHDSKKANIYLNKKYLKSKFQPISSLSYKYMPRITIYNPVPEKYIESYRGDFRQESSEKDYAHLKTPGMFLTSFQQKQLRPQMRKSKLLDHDKLLEKVENYFTKYYHEMLQDKHFENNDANNKKLKELFVGNHEYYVPEGIDQKSKESRNNPEEGLHEIEKNNDRHFLDIERALSRTYSKTPKIYQQANENERANVEIYPWEDIMYNSQSIKHVHKPVKHFISNNKIAGTQARVSSDEVTEDVYENERSRGLNEKNIESVEDDENETHYLRTAATIIKNCAKSAIILDEDMPKKSEDMKLLYKVKRINNSPEPHKLYFSAFSNDKEQKSIAEKNYFNSEEEKLKNINEYQLDVMNEESPKASDEIILPEEQWYENDETSDNSGGFSGVSKIKSNVHASAKDFGNTDDEEPFERIIITPNRIITEENMKDISEPKVGSSSVVKSDIDVPKMITTLPKKLHENRETNDNFGEFSGGSMMKLNVNDDSKGFNPEDKEEKPLDRIVITPNRMITEENMEHINEPRVASSSVMKFYIEVPDIKMDSSKKMRENEESNNHLGEFSRISMIKINVDDNAKNFGNPEDKEEEPLERIVITPNRMITQEIMENIYEPRVASSVDLKSYIEDPNVKIDFLEERFNGNDETNDNFGEFPGLSITKITADDNAKVFGNAEVRTQEPLERIIITPNKAITEENMEDVNKLIVASSSVVKSYIKDPNIKISLLEEQSITNDEMNKNFGEFSEVSSVIKMNVDDAKDFGNPGGKEEEPIERVIITPNVEITEENMEDVHEIRVVSSSVMKSYDDPNAKSGLLEKIRNDETNNNFDDSPATIKINVDNNAKDFSNPEDKEEEPLSQILIKPNKVITEENTEVSNEPSVASSLLVKSFIEVPKLKSKSSEIPSTDSIPASSIENESQKADSSITNSRMLKTKSYETPLQAQYINSLLFYGILSNEPRSEILKLSNKELGNSDSEMPINSEPDTYDKTCCSQELESKPLTENVPKEISKTNTPTQEEHEKSFETSHNPQLEKYSQRRQTLFEEPVKILEMSEITKQIRGGGRVNIMKSLKEVPNQDLRNFYALLKNEKGHDTFSEEKANFMKTLGGDPKRKIWLP